MPRQHIIYKTTNLVNGKFYIGKHSVWWKTPYYLGSGHALTAAIKKYGRENFVIEVLYTFDNVDECLAKEQELVTEELTNDPMCYNIATGGSGGKIQHSSTKRLIRDAVKKEWSVNKNRKNKASALTKSLMDQGKMGVKSWTESSIEKMSEAHKKRWSDPEYKKLTSAAISKGLTGKKQSFSHREANIKAQNSIRHCEYCDKDVKIAAYGRWHGDKCKGDK